MTDCQLVMVYCRLKPQGGLRMTLQESIDFLGCSERTLHRYVRKGELPYTIKDKKKQYKKKDLFKIALKMQENKDKHRPDVHEPKEKPLTKVQEMKKAIKAPTESLLNPVGKEILLDTTKLIRENNLIEGMDKSTVLRYAIAVQMKDHYVNLAHTNMEKYFFDIAKQFQAEIQHYERELGLTPAALRKLKPIQDEVIEVDPMEALLNGN